MKKISRSIVWFKNDLRVEDNKVLQYAIEKSKELLVVYVLDIQKQENGVNIGPHRLNFLLESLKDLRKNLKKRGSNLLVRVGSPQSIIPKIVSQVAASRVFTSQEYSPKMLEHTHIIESKLWKLGVELVQLPNNYLYAPQNLPFPIAQTPSNFLYFKKEMNSFIEISQPIRVKEQIPVCKIDISMGSIPLIKEYYPRYTPLTTTVCGGETEALKHLDEYLSSEENLKNYQKKQYPDINFSSKLSAYLSLGCISPRQVYQKVLEIELKYKRRKSLEIIKDNLRKRSYCRLSYKKLVLSKTVFPQKCSFNIDTFLSWYKQQKSVTPYIEKKMQELLNTGYVDYIARKNLAHFLIQAHQIGWQQIACFFEYILLDYDFYTTTVYCQQLFEFSKRSKNSKLLIQDIENILSLG